MSTTTKTNRLAVEVVVPHSPAPELNICVESFDTYGGGDGPGQWRAWVEGAPETWEAGSTRHSAIGALIEMLAMDDNHGIEVKNKSYHMDIAERNQRWNEEK